MTQYDPQREPSLLEVYDRFFPRNPHAQTQGVGSQPKSELCQSLALIAMTNSPLQDSHTAVLTSLDQLRSSGTDAWNHAGLAISALCTFALTLLGLCGLTIGAFCLKANEVAHTESFGVRKEAA